jgi:hypothetical protein
MKTGFSKWKNCEQIKSSLLRRQRVPFAATQNRALCQADLSAVNSSDIFARQIAHSCEPRKRLRLLSTDPFPLFGFMRPTMEHGDCLMVCDENQFLKSTISGTGNAT